MSRDSLIDLIKEGNETVLKELYQGYRDEFILWVNKHYHLDFDTCKEVYQVSMVQFYENVLSGKLTKLTSDPKSYIFGIGKNKVREMREIASKKFEPSKLAVASVEEKLNTEVLLEKVEYSLVKLGDPCRQLLTMFYYQNLSLVEITGRLGYKNSDTTKNLKYKCLNRLRKLFIDNK